MSARSSLASGGAAFSNRLDDGEMGFSDMKRGSNLLHCLVEEARAEAASAAG